VAGQRFVVWQNELHQWGFVLLPATRDLQAGELASYGRFPESAGVPQLHVSVREKWVNGRETGGLFGTTDGSCHLAACSWHAQFGGIDGKGEERLSIRLDLDRRKPQSLWLHEHPLFELNDRREPLRTLPTPAGWMHQVLALRAALIETMDEMDEVD